MSLLDEESQRGGSGGDEAFLARLCHTCGSSEYFETRNCAPSATPSDLPCNPSVDPNCFRCELIIPASERARANFVSFWCRLRHYAGTVTYNVAGFVEKNSDTLPLDMSLAMFRCDHSLLKNLFPEGKLDFTDFAFTTKILFHQGIQRGRP